MQAMALTIRTKLTTPLKASASQNSMLQRANASRMPDHISGSCSSRSISAIIRTARMPKERQAARMLHRLHTALEMSFEVTSCVSVTGRVCIR